MSSRDLELSEAGLDTYRYTRYTTSQSVVYSSNDATTAVSCIIVANNILNTPSLSIRMSHCMVVEIFR